MGVVLEDEYEPRTDVSTYINANYVPGPEGEPQAYVAAMGPLNNTIEAFWRMVWLLDSPAIVMTTPLAENGQVKCARYWPTVRYNHEKKCGDKKWGDIRVAVMKGRRREGFIETHLRISKGDEDRLVRHYWFTDWPDHGVPKSATNVINMLLEVQRFCKESLTTGPPVVHCSAGIGRTGTFIAIDHCISLLEKQRGWTPSLSLLVCARRAVAWCSIPSSTSACSARASNTRRCRRWHSNSAANPQSTTRATARRLWRTLRPLQSIGRNRCGAKSRATWRSSSSMASRRTCLTWSGNA